MLETLQLLDIYVVIWFIVNCIYWIIVGITVDCHPTYNECETGYASKSIRELFPNLTTFGKFVFYPLYIVTLIMEIGGFISLLLYILIMSIIGWKFTLVILGISLLITIILKLSFKNT